MCNANEGCMQESGASAVLIAPRLRTLNRNRSGRMLKFFLLMLAVVASLSPAFGSEADTILIKGSRYYYGGERIKDFKKFEPIFANCPAALDGYRTSRALGIPAMILTGVGGAVLGISIGFSISAEQWLWPMSVSSAPFLIAGLTLTGISSAKFKGAARAFNSGNCEESNSAAPFNTRGISISLSGEF